MTTDPAPEELCLRDGRPIRLADALGMRVRCLRGTIWITSAGESGDVFLQAGESHLIPRNGLSLVESIGGGRIRLEKTATGAGRWFDRIVGRWANSARSASAADQFSRTAPAPSAPDFPA